MFFGTPPRMSLFKKIIITVSKYSINIIKTICHERLIIIKNQSEAGETLHSFDMFSYFHTPMLPY